MVMEFSLINVNLNIDRKLLICMCAGLMLTIVLSDESNPVANFLRALPPISIFDRYVIPVVKTAFSYFRGHGNAALGSIGAKVPINPDSFIPEGFKNQNNGRERNQQRSEPLSGFGEAGSLRDGRSRQSDSDHGRRERHANINADRGGGHFDHRHGHGDSDNRPHGDRNQVSVDRALRKEGLIVDDQDALAVFPPSQGEEFFDEESMPKSAAEVTHESLEDAHEINKYADPNKRAWKKAKWKGHG